MNTIFYVTVAVAWACTLAACGADEGAQSQGAFAPPPSPAVDAPGEPAAPPEGPPDQPPVTTPTPAPVVMMDAGSSAPGAPGGATGATDAGPTDAGKSIPLPGEVTNVDVTQDVTRRFGAPHVAVNPTDPNNIVVLASSNLGYTKDCVPPPPGSDCEMIPAGGNPLLTQPRGFARTPGFMDIGVFVSFDRGQTFEQIDVSDLVPPGHPEVRARGEGPIAALADGTFFIGFNAINWGSWETPPLTFFPNGGVGVIKSTDGGRSWSWVSYSGTPADWPYGNSDPVTGTFYVTSGLAGLSTLGPRSTGLPDSPQSEITDRWIASTRDGTTWTEPQPLGGSNGGAHVGAGHSPVAAAHGIMATLFLKTDRASCSFFIGDDATSPCVVFQTSTDSGASWDRHRVPTPAGFTPAALSVLVGADPTRAGHFTVALLGSAGAEFLVFTTPDSGATWSGPTRVGEDPSKTHFAPFVATAPTGEFGLMWRTYEPDPDNPAARPPLMPYSVWAAISKDGGETFSEPLRVSLSSSPAPPSDPDDAFSFVGDHGSSGMAMDDEGGVYVVWADWTPGERAIFFSAIDQAAFTF